MRTLLDYVGLNPLRPLVAFGGEGEGGSGGGGDSRPDEAKGLDETGVSIGYGVGQVDPGLAAAANIGPVGGYSGITGPSSFGVSERADYSDVDLSNLPSLPQEIPVEYRDTTSGIEKVIDIYSPPTFDLTDPNETLTQDGEPFSGIAYGNLYASGQPVGPVSMDNIAALGGTNQPSVMDAISLRPDVDPIDSSLSIEGLLSDSVVNAPSVSPALNEPSTDVAPAINTSPFARSISLTDDDMGLPALSVDEAMFTSGNLGKSGVFGGTSISPTLSAVNLDPVNLATGDPMDPYSATLASSDTDAVEAGPSSVSLEDISIPQSVIDNYASYRSPPNAQETALLSGIMDAADRSNPIDNFMSSIVGQIIGINPQDLAQDALDAYKETGEFKYSDPNTVVGIRGPDGQTVYSGPGYRATEDGVINLADLFASDPGIGPDFDKECPDGYEFNIVTGTCEPIEEEVGLPKITLPDVKRPDPSPVRPDPGPIEPGPGFRGFPIEPDPIFRGFPSKGMKIRTPRFAEGGPVTPNIDRFLGSLRG